MIGLTVMEISHEEMVAVVQFYLNNDLLNTTFQDRHKSVVEDVRQRKDGRFIIEFSAKEEQMKITSLTAGAANA